MEVMVNDLLSDVPTKDIKPFMDAFIGHIHRRHNEVVKNIIRTESLSPEDEETIKGSLRRYKDRYYHERTGIKA